MTPAIIKTITIKEDFNSRITKENIIKYISYHYKIYPCKFILKPSTVNFNEFKEHINTEKYDLSLFEELKFDHLYLFKSEIFSIPKFITELDLGDNFNGLLANIGNQIEVLKIGKSYNKKLDFIPEQLKELNIYVPQIKKYILEIPENIKILTLYDKQNNLEYSKIKINPRSSDIHIYVDLFLKHKIKDIIHDYDIYKYNVHYFYEKNTINSSFEINIFKNEIFVQTRENNNYINNEIEEKYIKIATSITTEYNKNGEIILNKANKCTELKIKIRRKYYSNFINNLKNNIKKISIDFICSQFLTTTNKLTNNYKKIFSFKYFPPIEHFIMNNMIILKDNFTNIQNKLTGLKITTRKFFVKINKLPNKLKILSFDRGLQIKKIQNNIKIIHVHLHKNVEKIKFPDKIDKLILDNSNKEIINETMILNNIFLNNIGLLLTNFVINNKYNDILKNTIKISHYGKNYNKFMKNKKNRKEEKLKDSFYKKLVYLI